MKKIKCSVKTLLIMVLIAVLLSTNVMAASVFTDVPKNAFYANAVEWAWSNGITSGTDATHFSPNATCTRGEVVTFLWRSVGSPDPRSTVNPFKDVKQNKFYYKAVLWAYENDITAGITATTFGPNSLCTRGQVVTFLWRTANKPSATQKSNFRDVGTNKFYYNAVNWAVENGITAGVAEGRFAPDDSCSRGQIVTFLHRNYLSGRTDTVLYEDSTVKIKFKKAEKYAYEDDRAELYFTVENKKGRTLLIQADAVSLNGYSFCNLTMSDEVAAYSIGTINLSVEDFDFDLVNIHNLDTIGGQFRIIDDATWDSYDALFTNVKLDGTGTGGIPTDFSNSNILYSDKNCDIYYKSAEKYPYSSDRLELYFFVTNKTQRTLLIQADTISLNRYGFSNLIMSDPVLPNTIGIVNMSVEDFDFSLVNINNITDIGGQLRIIDDATWDSYDAIFPQTSDPSGSATTKWSYSDAYDLNTYAHAASSNSQEAWGYAIDAMSASSTYKVLYNQKAIYYINIAKNYLESMKSLADNRAVLELTNPSSSNYSTLQGKITYAYELCNEIADLQINSSNYSTYEDTIMEITQAVSMECLGIEKLSVDLMSAFAS